MKRYIAGSYANTSIMHPEVLNGIQERVNAFLRQCEDARGLAIDFYVNVITTLLMIQKLTDVGSFALFCNGLRLVPPAPPAWYQIHRGE